MKQLLLVTTKKTFDFLASIRLAVILLVVFAVLLSWATVLESKHSTDYVQRVVYQTFWFDLFLFILGLNVLFSALSRMPWKRRHTGFLITHLGIIVILFGSMLTRKIGIEGQMMLQEGMSTDSITLNEEAFSVRVPSQNLYQAFNPWFSQKGIPAGQEVRYSLNNSDINVYVTEYLKNPHTVEQVTNDSPAPNPAVQISFHRGDPAQSEFQDWLFAFDSSKNSLPLGIATINFRQISSDEELQQLLKKPDTPQVTTDLGGKVALKDAQGNTVYEFDAKSIENHPYAFELDGQTYGVQFKEFLPRAVVRNNILINNDMGALNPVIRFTLSSPQGQEEHLAFAKFPEFGSIHGQQASSSGFIAHFDYPISEDTPTANQLDLYLCPGNHLHYRTISAAGGWNSGDIGSGESIDTLWNGLYLQVVQYFPNARRIQQVVDAGMDHGGSHNNPAIKFRVEKQGKSVDSFVSYNAQQVVTVGNEQLIVEYGQRRYPVGFTLQLIDFRAPRYPGTNRPARFESEVKLIDPKQGVERESLVYMNNPLAYNNFLVYQASYIEGRNGEPDISIFSVAKAPGTPIIYLGTIISTIGMILMFASKKYSSLYYYRLQKLEQKGETS